MTISFDTSREESRIITKIAQRAAELAKHAGQLRDCFAPRYSDR